MLLRQGRSGWCGLLAWPVKPRVGLRRKRKDILLVAAVVIVSRHFDNLVAGGVRLLFLLRRTKRERALHSRGSCCYCLAAFRQLGCWRSVRLLFLFFLSCTLPPLLCTWSSTWIGWTCPLSNNHKYLFIGVFWWQHQKKLSQYTPHICSNLSSLVVLGYKPFGSGSVKQKKKEVWLKQHKQMQKKDTSKYVCI